MYSLDFKILHYLKKMLIGVTYFFLYILQRSTSVTCLMSELGELIVLLQYQMSANRLKVLVRKAEGIPNKDKIPGGSCGMSQV